MGNKMSFGDAFDQIVTFLITKGLSRKLMVFLVASFFYYQGKIDTQIWETIAIMYVGAQAAIDMTTAWNSASATPAALPQSNSNSSDG